MGILAPVLRLVSLPLFSITGEVATPAFPFRADTTVLVADNAIVTADSF